MGTQQRAEAGEAIPQGYGPAVLAVLGFAVAGVGDAAWHSVFGVEQSLNILFSPTHLGLVTAMLVIVTTPLRAAWADPDLSGAPGLRRLLPALLSMALATTLVLLFLQYANAFAHSSEDVVYGLSGADEGHSARLVASFAVTTAMLVVPLLTIARRWALPFGTATVLFAFVGALSLAVTGPPARSGRRAPRGGGRAIHGRTGRPGAARADARHPARGRQLAGTPTR